MKLILASASPRRIELLQRFKFEFEIIPSNFDEQQFYDNPVEMVTNFAYNKALDVKKRVNEDAIIVAADTIVYKDGKILGKPKNKQEAIEMLKFISNGVHEVYTGIAVIYGDEKIVDFECTRVFFNDITEEEIIGYVETNEPLDKAGAYAIQGIGSLFVSKIEGCYNNVVGLPVNKLYSILRRMGIKIL